jgi:hypothetical protein
MDLQLHPNSLMVAYRYIPHPSHSLIKLTNPHSSTHITRPTPSNHTNHIIPIPRDSLCQFKTRSQTQLESMGENHILGCDYGWGIGLFGGGADFGMGGRLVA